MFTGTIADDRKTIPEAYNIDHTHQRLVRFALYAVAEAVLFFVFLKPDIHDGPGLLRALMGVPGQIPGHFRVIGPAVVNGLHVVKA